ncbi:MAG: radical SAM protein [Planctomycetia bacterium]|nr:radical SAM protein [Planctomycetia bacterium]
MEATKSTTCTYSGRPIPALERGLPKTVGSLCPECIAEIPATLYEDQGKVWMKKRCPEHGEFLDIYWSDARLYLKAEEFHYGDGRGLENPNTEADSACPRQCGLCEEHLSHTALGNIDLTNRCNLRCPVCFANAAATGSVYEPTFEQVVKMLELYRATRPVATRAVQFAGGEPTLYGRFLDVLRKAREMGFSHLQVATNGLRFAEEDDFAQKASDAGLHDIYLQMDGISDDVYISLRGRRLWELKQRAIENISRTTMKIVFVPTIVRGINDGQVGAIVQYALNNIETVSGISFQPVSFTGRIERSERLRQRFTLSDLAHAVADQTGISDPYEDWYPLSCIQPFTRLHSAVRGEANLQMTCHPHCSLGTYLFVGRRGDVVPLPQFFDLPAMLGEMNRLADKGEQARFKFFTKISAFRTLKRHWRPERAPSGMTFDHWLHTLNGMIDKNVGRGVPGEKTFRSLLVAGMHFMDSYNYETARARRCVIHYAAPDGRLYPFCTYNAGPTFRTAVEERFAVTAEQWRKSHKG